MLRGAIVCLDDSGLVVGIETGGGDMDSRPGVEFYDGVLIPGMVNAHCHLELSHMAGRMSPGSGYAGFAKGMATLREAPADEVVRAARFWDAAMWRQGVQAVGDVSNSAATFGVKGGSPVHYHTFVEVFGLGADTGPAVALCAQARAAGLSASVSPHSAYSLSRDGFRRAVEATPGGLLSVHFMESPEEVGLFAGEGAMAEWYRRRGWEPDFLDYGSPAGRIVAQLPADRRWLSVHNTCVTAAEARELAVRYGANLNWVVCPRSNGFITGAVPPLGVLRGSGANIAVGTDSLASNHRLSMVDEMLALQSAGAALSEIVEWCTSGGARALGLDGTMGSIEVGKRPGIALLTGVDFGTMTLTDGAATRRIA